MASGKKKRDLPSKISDVLRRGTSTGKDLQKKKNRRGRPSRKKSSRGGEASRFVKRGLPGKKSGTDTRFTGKEKGRLTMTQRGKPSIRSIWLTTVVPRKGGERNETTREGRAVAFRTKKTSTPRREDHLVLRGEGKEIIASGGEGVAAALSEQFEEEILQGKNDNEHSSEKKEGYYYRGKKVSSMTEKIGRSSQRKA